MFRHRGDTTRRRKLQYCGQRPLQDCLNSLNQIKRMKDKYFSVGARTCIPALLAWTLLGCVSSSGGRPNLPPTSEFLYSTSVFGITAFPVTASTGSARPWDTGHIGVLVDRISSQHSRRSRGQVPVCLWPGKQFGGGIFDRRHKGGPDTSQRFAFPNPRSWCRQPILLILRANFSMLPRQPGSRPST
jgi:hypothetical protein